MFRSGIPINHVAPSLNPTFDSLAAHGTLFFINNNLPVR
jgi:hypothetical protein